MQIAVLGIVAVFLVLMLLAALVKVQSWVVQGLERGKNESEESRIRAVVIAAVRAYIEGRAEP